MLDSVDWYRQRRLVVVTDVSGQPVIGPIFKSQAAWHLKMLSVGCPETSVANSQSTLRNIPQEQRSSCFYLLLCLYSRSKCVIFYVGWAIATEEREWKYRLSVYYTKPQDSGVFTCATPRGLTNSITVHVAGKLSHYLMCGAWTLNTLPCLQRHNCSCSFASGTEWPTVGLPRTWMVGKTVLEVSHSLTVVLFQTSQTQVRHLTQHFGKQSIVSHLLVLVHCKIFSVQKTAET